MTAPGIRRARVRLTPVTVGVAALAVAVWLAGVQPWQDAASWPAARVPLGGASAGALLAWLLVVAGFVVADRTQLHVELRRETHSLSLSEIPLVLGVLTLHPLPLLAARLLGALVVSAARRTAMGKAAFNLAAFAVGTGIVEAVFRPLSGGALAGPRSWLSVYAAVTAGELVTVALVGVAIVRLQGTLPRRDLLQSVGTALLSTLTNTTVALLVLIVARADGRALVLLLVLLLALAAAYQAYSVLLRRHRTLGLMHTFTAAVRGIVELDVMVPEVLRQGRALLAAGRAALVLADGTGGWLLYDGDRGPVPLPGVDELVAQVLDGRCSVLVPRGGAGRAQRAWLRSWRLRDAVLSPVTDGDTVVGCLLVGDRLGEMASFSRDDLQLLETVAAHVGVALLGVRLVERLRHEARHDALTGLPNRTLFQERLAGAVAAAGPEDRCAVLLLDLDGFKDVNDTLGHHNGDVMLCEVATRLRAAVPADVTVARLGGDEFALLVPGDREDDGSRLVASLLHRVLRRPFSIDGVPLEIRASVGVARFPRDGADAAVLLQRADVAMYAAKGAHAPVQVYEPELDRSSPRRLTLAGELRTAISDGQLECFYQPKVTLGERLVVGVEALVRWRHPVLGLVPPDDFISIAEHTGLIVPLTSLVLRQAVVQSAAWLEAGQAVSMAVNVSPRGLLARGFVDEVALVLRESGLPTGLLTLELTESSVMSDPAGATAVLRRLHDLGVRLSVDDFGTGYSSLSYLQRLPVDEVKIDMSFVRNLATDPHDAAIVRAIIELGHALGLAVVAEGVEDQRGFDILASYGCDLAQGYLISRPLAASVMTGWLSEVGAWGKPRDGRPRLSVAR